MSYQRYQTEKAMRLPPLVKQGVNLVNHPTISSYMDMTRSSDFYLPEPCVTEGVDDYVIVAYSLAEINGLQRKSKKRILALLNRLFDGDQIDIPALFAYIENFLDGNPICILHADSNFKFSTFEPVLQYKNGKFLWNHQNDVHAGTFESAFVIGVRLTSGFIRSELQEIFHKAKNNFDMLTTDLHAIEDLLTVSAKNKVDVCFSHGEPIAKYIGRSNKADGFIFLGNSFQYELKILYEECSKYYFLISLYDLYPSFGNGVPSTLDIDYSHLIQSRILPISSLKPLFEVNSRTNLPAYAEKDHLKLSVIKSGVVYQIKLHYSGSSFYFSIINEKTQVEHRCVANVDKSRMLYFQATYETLGKIQKFQLGSLFSLIYFILSATLL